MPHRKKIKTSGLYSTLDICSILSIPRERLRDWMVREFVKPAHYQQPGKGKGVAVFDLAHLYKAALFKLLVAFGFRRSTAADLIKSVHPDALLTNFELILTVSLYEGFIQHKIRWNDTRLMVDCWIHEWARWRNVKVRRAAVPVKKARKTQFKTWLYQQKDREDPVGDLARDAIQDPKCPLRLDAWRAYLTLDIDASDSVLSAFERAKTEYTGE